MTVTNRLSGKNGQVYAQTGHVKVGYSGTNSNTISSGGNSVTLVNSGDATTLGYTLAGIDNTMFITITDGVHTERKPITTYVAGTGIVTITGTFTYGYAAGSTVTIGQASVLNTQSTVVDNVTFPAYAVASVTVPGALNSMIDAPYPTLSIVAADGLVRTPDVRFVYGKSIIVPALQAGDTVDVAYFYPTLTQIGDMKTWKVSLTVDNVETTAFAEGYKSKVPTFRNWTGSADGFLRQQFWFQKFATADTIYVKLAPSQAYSGNYWYGRAILNGYDTGADIGAAVMENLKFEGVGPLVQVGF